MKRIIAERRQRNVQMINELRGRGVLNKNEADRAINKVNENIKNAMANIDAQYNAQAYNTLWGLETYNNSRADAMAGNITSLLGTYGVDSDMMGSFTDIFNAKNLTQAQQMIAKKLKDNPQLAKELKEKKEAEAIARANASAGNGGGLTAYQAAQLQLAGRRLDLQEAALNRNLSNDDTKNSQWDYLNR